MRLKVSLRATPGSQIDHNYSYHLSSAIYRAIERADSSLSLELHLPNVPKFFTFMKPEIKIGKEFTLSQIEVLKEKKIGSKEKFVTLSPIYVSKAENRKAIDLYPVPST